MLLPDVNVLLAAFRGDHDHHRPARAFLEHARGTTEVLCLSDVALSGVLRLATNSRVFVRPDTSEAVLAYLDALLEPPGQLVRAGTTHWARFTELCRQLTLRGNLVPDAYLAALAIEHGCEVITADRDFRRFPGLRWRHPLN